MYRVEWYYAAMREWVDAKHYAAIFGIALGMAEAIKHEMCRQGRSCQVRVVWRENGMNQEFNV